MTSELGSVNPEPLEPGDRLSAWHPSPRVPAPGQSFSVAEHHQHHLDDLRAFRDGMKQEMAVWSALKGDECNEVRTLEKDVQEVEKWLAEWGDDLHEWWEKHRNEKGEAQD